MTIQVQCQCGARLSVPDQFAGKRGKCPKCGSAVAIPAAATSATANSPSPSPAAGAPASPSLEPQLHNPLHGAAQFPGQPYPPSGPAADPWGNAAGWPGMQGQGMMGPQGMQSPQGMMGNQGMPAFGGFGPQGGNDFGQPQFAAPTYPQQKAKPRKKLADSDTVKRISKIAGGVVGFAVAFVVSFLVRNALQTGLGNLSWQQHQSAAGRYRVEFPGKPQTKSSVLPTDVGTMTLWMDGVELKRGHAFIVMYSDVPSHIALDAQTLLSEGLMGLGSQFPTHNVTEIEYDGHPGREAYYTADRGNLVMHGRVRLILAGRRLYQVHFVGKEGTEQHPDVERFLNSFHPE